MCCKQVMEIFWGIKRNRFMLGSLEVKWFDFSICTSWGRRISFGCGVPNATFLKVVEDRDKKYTEINARCQSVCLPATWLCFSREDDGIWLQFHRANDSCFDRIPSGVPWVSALANFFEEGGLWAVGPRRYFYDNRFVAQYLLLNSGRFHLSLRIYIGICPKISGFPQSNPVTWEWDWGHQSYPREGYWSLRFYMFVFPAGWPKRSIGRSLDS